MVQSVPWADAFLWPADNAQASGTYAGLGLVAKSDPRFEHEQRICWHESFPPVLSVRAASSSVNHRAGRAFNVRKSAATGRYYDYRLWLDLAEGLNRYRGRG